MEAVRLTFPRDVTKLIRDYASDRIGVHPSANAWKEDVCRNEYDCGAVEWLMDIPNGVGNGHDRIEFWPCVAMNIIHPGENHE